MTIQRPSFQSYLCYHSLPLKRLIPLRQIDYSFWEQFIIEECWHTLLTVWISIYILAIKK